MILTAHQPQFFAGYAGYISKILESDVYLYMDDVDYEKGSFTNRNRIRNSQGWQWLTVPILKPYGKIKDIRIDNTKPWREKHLKSIEQNYSKAKYFDRYYQPIRDVYYGEQWEYLSDFNLFALGTVLKELGITTPIIRQSDGDYHGTKSELILDFCLKTGADWFIFGLQGRDYCNEKIFEAAGIQVEYQDYTCNIYPQCYDGFVERLSVLDLLMCMGPNSLDIIRGNESKT